MRTTRTPDSAWIASRLAQSHAFETVPANDLEELSRACRVRRLARDQILFSQGDVADAFYIIGSGRVSLVLSGADGRELVINDMRPGDGFGELGLLTGETRSTSAIAREPTEAVAIPRSAFLSIVDSQPALARRLLETAARRLRMASDREGALAFLDAPSRLARVLLLLDQRAAADGYIVASQEDLAQYAGLVRQSVASLLGRWRRRGWVVTGRGRIVVLDRSALRRTLEDHQS